MEQRKVDAKQCCLLQFKFSNKAAIVIYIIILRSDSGTCVCTYVRAYVRAYVRGHAFGILEIIQGDSVFFKILTLIVLMSKGSYIKI